MKKKSENTFTEMEKAMITEDGNIKRYLYSNIVDKFGENQMATLSYPNGYGHGTRVHNDSIALTTGQQPVVKKNLRIRKLTPKECIRLMGFEDEDYQALRDVSLSDSAIYHCAGDSIIVTCLMGLLGQITIGEDETKQKIKDYVESIVERKKYGN